MEKQETIKALRKALNVLISLVVVVCIMLCSLFYVENIYDPYSFETSNNLVLKESVVNDSERVENGIHLASGFKADENLGLVINNCTACHSSKLIIQNRATKEGWLAMIRWMQETQNLWNLGENEKPILEYLSKNYAPQNKGRRAPLENIEWYELGL